MKLLLIEDDSDIVEAISLAFQIRWPEAQVISTQSGKKGVGLVESVQPDIVILDLGLPDIDGFTVLRKIRLFSQVPIIIVTVRADESDIIKGLEWGADDYIIKPFRQLELLARVKAQIRRQGQDQE
ncbi:response regulator transcription factor [Chloroflexota bacterium]